jgi:hypothetical protein
MLFGAQTLCLFLGRVDKCAYFVAVVLSFVSY